MNTLQSILIITVLICFSSCEFSSKGKWTDSDKEKAMEQINIAEEMTSSKFSLKFKNCVVKNLESNYEKRCLFRDVFSTQYIASKIRELSVSIS